MIDEPNFYAMTPAEIKAFIKRVEDEPAEYLADFEREHLLRVAKKELKRTTNADTK